MTGYDVSDDYVVTGCYILGHPDRPVQEYFEDYRCNLYNCVQSRLLDLSECLEQRKPISSLDWWKEFKKEQEEWKNEIFK